MSIPQPMQPAVGVAGPVIVQQQPVAVLQQIEKYAPLFFRLGVIEVILGILSIGFGSAVFGYADSQDNGYYYYYDSFAYLATGIWCGVFFLASGILGIIAGKRKEYCPVTGALVMTIFSALAASTLFGIETAGAVENADYDVYYYDTSVNVGLHAALSVIGFTELIVAIVHSSYCCVATNCCKAQPRQTPYVVTTTTYQNLPQFTTVAPMQQQIVQTNVPLPVAVQVAPQPVFSQAAPVPGVSQQAHSMPQQPYAVNAGYSPAPPAYSAYQNTQKSGMPPY